MSATRCSIPHAGGGDPTLTQSVADGIFVFPAYAGVILAHTFCLISPKKIPREYGGVPDEQFGQVQAMKCPPRMVRGGDPVT